MKFNKILSPEAIINIHYHGWSFIIESIKKDIIDENSNIVLDSFADSCFWEPKPDILFDWVGIVHSVASDSDNLHYQTLHNYVQHPWFLQNKTRCLKLITLSKYTADILRSLTDIPVTNIYHPKFCGEYFFNIDSYFNNPQLSQSGFHARNFLKFAEFNTKIYKNIYVNKGCNNNYLNKYLSLTPHNINIKNCFLNNTDYIHNLTKSIGFAYYNDVAASNALLEHIVTHTPIIVNKLPAVVEYIGKNYPLFYEDIQHDPDRYLLDKKHIIQCTNYLKEHSKSDIFTIAKFKQDLLSV
jgi:hypothetical protein